MFVPAGIRFFDLFLNNADKLGYMTIVLIYLPFMGTE